MMRRIGIAVVCTLLSAGVVLASWYDDYEAGLKAVKAGQWKTAAEKMSSAIAGNKNENNNARTYGNIFINYHPFYYRAVAYINLGQYQKAISDLEQTSGPGPVDRGSIDVLMAQAKQGLETPAPVTPQQPAVNIEPPITKPPVNIEPPIAKPPVNNPPAPPAIDSMLRNRARAALDNAKMHLQTAQQRNATAAPSYQQAQQQYIEANNRWASAKSNDDLNVVLAAAENITLLADGAQPIIVTKPPKVDVATGDALGELNRRLRQALENYFNGDFDVAEHQFQALTKELPRNGWIWAFLGASQYSQYAFEGDDSYKDAAVNSFKKARAYGKWKNGLPDKYFSRRIRNAFKQIAG